MMENIFSLPFSPFQILPFRSKTSLATTHLNSYITKNSKPHSKLRISGQAFIDTQNKYGVNALTALSVTINESAFGTSDIALKRNNFFGIGAIDVSTSSSAKTSDCINNFTKNKISTSYANPKFCV